MSHIILATNSSRKAVALGQPRDGQPFETEEAATKAVKKAEQRWPTANFLVLSVEAWDTL